MAAAATHQVVIERRTAEGVAKSVVALAADHSVAIGELAGRRVATIFPTPAALAHLIAIAEAEDAVGGDEAVVIGPAMLDEVSGLARSGGTEAAVATLVGVGVPASLATRLVTALERKRAVVSVTVVHAVEAVEAADAGSLEGRSLTWVDGGAFGTWIVGTPDPASVDPVTVLPADRHRLELAIGSLLGQSGFGRAADLEVRADA